MPSSTPAGERAAAPTFALIDVRLRAGPILATFLLGGIVTVGGIALGRVVAHHAFPGAVARHDWARAWAGHLGQLAVGLLAIALVRRRAPGAYGLRRPEGKSYVGAAVAWGVAFGVVMTSAAAWPVRASRRGCRGASGCSAASCTSPASSSPSCSRWRTPRTSRTGRSSPRW